MASRTKAVPKQSGKSKDVPEFIPCAWPENESVPQSYEEALSLGWEVPWSFCKKEGVQRMKKTTADGALLYINVPFTSKIEYGTPQKDDGPFLRDNPDYRRKVQIFDVVFNPPEHRIVRVRAEDEEDAQHLAFDFFEFSLTARKPDKEKRVVHEYSRSRSHGFIATVTRKRGVSSRDPQGDKNV
jgi:hypothetical protein